MKEHLASFIYVFIILGWKLKPPEVKSNKLSHINLLTYKTKRKWQARKIYNIMGLSKKTKKQSGEKTIE